MDRVKKQRLIGKMSEAFCMLNDVRGELIAEYGDDCGLSLVASEEAPSLVRRCMARAAERFDLVPHVNPAFATPALRLLRLDLEMAAVGAD